MIRQSCTGGSAYFCENRNKLYPPAFRYERAESTHLLWRIYIYLYGGEFYGTATDSTKFNNKTWAEMLLANYPVGAIYLSVNSTSPASLFGGTWEQLKDRFLLGAGNSYSINATGGATTHTHTTGNHTLTINEMPYHSHDSHFNWPHDHADRYIGSANSLTWESYKWTSNDYLLDINTATYAGGS